MQKTTKNIIFKFSAETSLQLGFIVAFYPLINDKHTNTGYCNARKDFLFLFPNWKINL